LQFHGDGTGKAVYWEAVNSATTARPQAAG
jgi:hypothetical protein